MKKEGLRSRRAGQERSMRWRRWEPECRIFISRGRRARGGAFADKPRRLTVSEGPASPSDCVMPFLPSTLARRVAASAAHLARRRRRDLRRTGISIRLDYPLSSIDGPRDGYGRSPHPRLAELLDRYADRYRAGPPLLEPYEPDLLAIGRSRSDESL